MNKPQSVGQILFSEEYSNGRFFGSGAPRILLFQHSQFQPKNKAGSVSLEADKAERLAMPLGEGKVNGNCGVGSTSGLVFKRFSSPKGGLRVSLNYLFLLK